MELVGRSRELVDIEDRVRTNRLVTIVGPGGVGKTALARTAAERLRDRFARGVFHVDLTRLDDPAGVGGAIASQLGFDSFDALMASPGDQPALVVVDNCEHVLDAAAEALVQVLGACRQPTVVATSRSPLEVPGESLVPLAPLPMPTLDDDDPTNASVELFLLRCRDAGASVEDGQRAAIVDLCRQLDGLPLAIEIAAARTRTMPIAEIVERLDASVDVLTRRTFRGDPRHRSVTETIRWSYELLTPGARQLLAELSVFSGPFLLRSARAVTATPGDFDDRIDELISASLVVADTAGTSTHLRLLDTVRRFARDRLRERGELERTSDRFVDYVIASTRALMSDAETAWRSGLVSDVVASFDDIAEAMRWCLANDDDPRRAYRLTAPLWTVVHQAHADDVVDLLRRLFERFPHEESRGAAYALVVLATAEYVTGNPQRALDIAEPLAVRYADDDIVAVLLQRILGQARNAGGDLAGASTAFAAGARIAGQLGMAALAQEQRTAGAVVTADGGDLAAALDAVDQVIDDAAASASPLTGSWAATVRAWLLVRRDPRQALQASEAALAVARELDYPIAIAVDLRTRAYASMLLGDLPAARASVSELLDELLDRGALSNVRLVADAAAALAFRAGHPGWEQLAATARSLPITTLAGADFELIPLPATNVDPLPRHHVVNVIRSLLGELAVTYPALPASTSANGAVGAATIRRLGDVYEFDFGGRAVTVRTSKGLVDIVGLVGAAGGEVHCLDLADAGVQAASTGEVIDATARRQYEARIRDLQADIDDAEHDNDYARAYRHQVELDALIDHLSAALGHGGATRQAAGTTERARSAVTHRIRAAVRQIDKLHPSLGNHLTHAIRTGTYCSYRPEHPVTWTIHDE